MCEDNLGLQQRRDADAFRDRSRLNSTPTYIQDLSRQLDRIERKLDLLLKEKEES
jgi:hypothetical protein